MSFARSGFNIETNPQSDNNVVIVFLRCISFSIKLDGLPSNKNNSLKCTIKYLPCLCKMWHDWYSFWSLRDATPIRVNVSLILRKSSGSLRDTSSISAGTHSFISLFSFSTFINPMFQLFNLVRSEEG